MPSAIGQSTPATVSESSLLHSTLRRLWPAYCFLAALVTFGYALWDPYQIDGDAVSYMDIGDLIRSHQWAGVVNGYWHPLYPAALSLGHIIFHATRFTELHAYYMVNFGIFLLQMLTVVTFTDAIIRFRDARESSIFSRNPPRFVLDRHTLRYIGVSALVIAAQRELSLGKVRPDALLQALLLFSLAALLTHLATGRLRYAGLMGLALGLAYLTKSFAFLFALLCIFVLVAFRWRWQRHSLSHVAAAGLLAATCFAIIAGPYIAALTKQKGRFNFGDSGTLNYAWYVGGTEKMHLQQYQTELFGSADVHLKHPEKELLRSPAIFSYRQLPYGTYPDWFDATFWNDQIKTHTNIRGEVRTISRNLVLVLRYLLNHSETWLLLVVLILLGARPAVGLLPSSNSFWLAPVLLGLAVFAIYGLVNIEERYVTVGFLSIALPLLATLRVPSLAKAGSTRRTASALVLLLALLAVGESSRIVLDLRRRLSGTDSPGGWYDAETFRAAQALKAMGVGPGDTIACIGTRACLYDHYWARLAGVRILTEVYVPQRDLYPMFAAMPNRAQAIDLVRQQGDKVLVGYFSPGVGRETMLGSAGWVQLDNSLFSALPLNLPPTPPAASAHR